MQTNDNLPSEGNITSQPQFNGRINAPLSDGLSSVDNGTDEPVNDKEILISPINQVEDLSDTDMIADQEIAQPIESSEFDQSTGSDTALLSIRRNTETPELESSRLEKYFKKETEFKTKIQERNFFEAFAAVVEDLVQLEVITIVEDEVNVNYQSLEQIEGLPGKRMVTIINLLDGDIKNIIGSRFVEGEYTKLRDYHAEQVVKSHAILKGNLECLSTAIKSLLDIKKQEDEIKPLLKEP